MMFAFKANATEDVYDAVNNTEPSTSDSDFVTDTEYGWQLVNDNWYYTNSDGLTYSDGIFAINDKKYLFDESGCLLSGLQKCDGKLYYFTTSGNSPENGFGSMAEYKGWKVINSSTYYFNSKHSAYTGWKTISSNKYYFGDNGKMKVGWTKIGKKIFYFKKTGKLGTKGRMLTGWKKINDKRFYFSTKGSAGTKGAMASGFKNIGKNTFYFKATGKLGNKGVLQTGWKKIGKYNYYFKASGKLGVKGQMVKNQIAGTKKLGYGYVDSKGRKITTKAITLATKFVIDHTSKNHSRSQKLSEAFNYLWRNYSYKRIYGLPNENTLSNNYAGFMLENKQGNCFCYGATFACIAKVLGYESRVGSGLISSAAGGMTSHGWAEVKINGVWYIFDPDMQREKPGISTYMRTRANYPYRLRCNTVYSLTFKNAKVKWKKSA